MLRSLRLCRFLGVIGLVQAQDPGGGQCPDPQRFERWIAAFAESCQPLADDLSCSWVTCDCLQVSLQVPVELSLVPTCFQEGVETQLLTQDQRRIASELVRGSACGSVTRELGKPCGQCDGFRLERPQCYDTTAPPYRTFISGAPVHSVGMFTGLVLATFKLLADEFPRC
ncbi:unnamed protein product [Symbiodinium sp. CCMP2592]|nr:unnamed protein product [Symbiodinium sp. CCMP2592]